MDETRGQAAKGRRVMLGVSREAVAHEAGVSVRTVASYEKDARENMPSGDQIEAALDRLETQGQNGAARNRRATDTPQQCLIDAVLEVAEGEFIVRTFADGTRTIVVVPEGGHEPGLGQPQRVLLEARWRVDGSGTAGR